MSSIEFENRKYKIREVEIEETGARIIASTDLNNILFLADGNYKSDEATFVDEQIYFYVDSPKLKLNDSALSKYVSKYCV